MALLLHEIEWEKPLFPPTPDADWEAELKQALGGLPGWGLYITDSQWIRDAMVDIHREPLSHTPGRLIGIAMLVSSQENSCRYCYGAVRAHMRIMGVDEATIDRLERDTQLADSDEFERVFVKFCRSLARSNPRPASKERGELQALGLEPVAVAEIAFWIAATCFVNRVSTFIATPPFAQLETMAESWWGKLLRPLIARKLKWSAPQADYASEPKWDGPYGLLVDLLEGSPSAPALSHILRGCFTQGPLSREAKLMIFAVVARSLQCPVCVAEAGNNLELSDAAFEQALSRLTTDSLPEDERPLLDWARESVWYESADMQRKTRALMETLGKARTLDAIGTVSLANTCVRLMMLAR